jgi:DNA adenine methylase/adenine-specific DNA-methyltransferase
MGSKSRLLPWIHATLRELDFETALDPFCGSGAVAYLLKAMGKQVTACDVLAFPSAIAAAIVENADERISAATLGELLEGDARHDGFVEKTFAGIFFTPGDLRFLDATRANAETLASPQQRALAIAALVRACAKRQPRGVFTVAGDPERYKDGRRDLRLSLREHFVEQVAAYDAAVFSNGRANRAFRSDVFAAPTGCDLVYLDPPYVPRADDNCYVKRYHFLEGLATYWKDAEIVATSRVKKLAKPFTPFAYRSEAVPAFTRLFERFQDSTLVLSYSSNGYPDLDSLRRLMRRFKRRVEVFERPHRYHFGTHARVRAERAVVEEYLLVGT